MSFASALINFEPPPIIIGTLPLTIRWKVEKPLDGAIQVVLASFGQGLGITAQLNPTFVLNAEHNLQSAIIPRIDLDPGLYVILAMNTTDRDLILAVSQSFYFLPTPSTSTSTESDSNANPAQEPGACDVFVPAAVPVPAPYPNPPMIALICIVAVLSISVVATLLIALWRSFLRRRGRGSKGCTETFYSHTANISRFINHQSVYSDTTEKRRALKITANSLSSADGVPDSLDTSVNPLSPIPSSVDHSSPFSITTRLESPSTPRSPPSSTAHLQTSSGDTSSKSSSRISAGIECDASEPPPQYSTNELPV